MHKIKGVRARERVTLYTAFECNAINNGSRPPPFRVLSLSLSLAIRNIHIYVRTRIRLYVYTGGERERERERETRRPMKYSRLVMARNAVAANPLCLSTRERDRE